MLTFEEAKAIAMEEWPTIDCSMETVDAFIFHDTKAPLMLGGCPPVVVIKEDGMTYDMTNYLDAGFNDTTVRPYHFFDGTPVPNEDEDYDD